MPAARSTPRGGHKHIAKYGYAEGVKAALSSADHPHNSQVRCDLNQSVSFSFKVLLEHQSFKPP